MYEFWASPWMTRQKIPIYLYQFRLFPCFMQGNKCEWNVHEVGRSLEESTWVVFLSLRKLPESVLDDLSVANFLHNSKGA